MQVGAFLKRIMNRAARWPSGISARAGLKQCLNFTVIGDIRAARIVFQSDLPFVLFDTGAHPAAPWTNRSGGLN